MVNFIAGIFVIFFMMFLVAAIIAVGVIMVQIAIRFWSNTITPWIDKHFGEIDW